MIVRQPVEMTISAASVQKRTLIPNKLYFVVFLQASMSPKMITIYMTATRMRTMGVWVRNMKSCTVRRSGHTSPQDLNTSKYPSDIPPDFRAGCKIWVKQQYNVLFHGRLCLDISQTTLSPTLIKLPTELH